MKKLEQMSIEELMAEYKGHQFTYLKGGQKKLVGVTPEGELAYAQVTSADKAEKKEFDEIANALVRKFLDIHSSRALPERVIGAEAVAATVSPEIKELAEKICTLAAEKYDYFTLQSVFQRMEPAWVFDRPVVERLEDVCRDILPKVAICGEQSLTQRVDHFGEVFRLKSADRAKLLKAYKSGLKKTQKQLSPEADFSIITLKDTDESSL